jgi:hypothetical protein
VATSAHITAVHRARGDAMTSGAVVAAAGGMSEVDVTVSYAEWTRWLVIHHAGTQRVQRGLGAILYTEFAEDRAHMCFHSFLGNREYPGYLAV